MEYNYPIDHDWSTDELVTVMKFYETIEKAYESGVSREMVLEAYNGFKRIVPSKAQEKTLLKEFEQVSGYSGYLAVKEAKNASEGEVIKKPGNRF